MLKKIHINYALGGSYVFKIIHLIGWLCDGTKLPTSSIRDYSPVTNLV